MTSRISYLNIYRRYQIGIVDRDVMLIGSCLMDEEQSTWEGSTASHIGLYKDGGTDGTVVDFDVGTC